MIEWVFATVGLRQRVTKGGAGLLRAKGLTMGLGLVAMAEKRWLRSRRPQLVGAILKGTKFVAGESVTNDTQEGRESVA